MRTLQFQSWEQLRTQNSELYSLLGKLGGYQHYDLLPRGDMKPGHWFLKNNPNFVTEAQWQTLCLRMLSFESLKSKTLSEVIDTFYYEQSTLVVEGEKFYIPSGNIMGYLQGMFMCIDSEGNINT